MVHCHSTTLRSSCARRLDKVSRGGGERGGLQAHSRQKFSFHDVSNTRSTFGGGKRSCTYSAQDCKVKKKPPGRMFEEPKSRTKIFLWSLFFLCFSAQLADLAAKFLRGDATIVSRQKKLIVYLISEKKNHKLFCLAEQERAGGRRSQIPHHDHLPRAWLQVDGGICTRGGSLVHEV